MASWADHRGLFLYPGDDMGQFDGRWFEVIDVVSADTLRLRASPPVRVRLCGLVGPVGEQDRNAEAAEQLIRQLSRRWRVRLHLDPRWVRHASGELSAFVEMEDGTLLNEHLLAAGLAGVRVGEAHRLADRFELIEAQARHDGVGLWVTAS